MVKKKILTALLVAGMAFSAFGGIVNADTTVGDSAETSESSQETRDLSAYSFENVYGSQVYPFLEHQYTFQGQAIPVAESNFYFINAFFELTQYAYYGMYPQTSEGFIDLAAEYSDPTKYATYGDFLISYAERTLESSLIICERARNENLLLSDETLASIDEMIGNLSAEAQQANMTLDQYLQLYYGPSCSEAAYRDILKNYYLSDLYTSKYCDDHITDEMRYVPNIRYALFYAPQEGTESADLQSAEALANDLVNAANGDLDALKTLGDQSVTDGFCRESNDIAVSRGQTVSAFEAWAYGEGRQEGDIEVIYAPEYGYFVVGYLGMTEQDTQTLDTQIVAQLTDEISEEIESGMYQFETEQEFAPAVPVAGGDSAITDPTGSTIETSTISPESGKSGVATILIIIFAVIGGVAIIAIIIILTAYIVKKINAGKSDKFDKSDRKDSSKSDYEKEREQEEKEVSDEE